MVLQEHGQLFQVSILPAAPKGSEGYSPGTQRAKS